MTRQDVCRLFDLLEQLYQGKKKPRDAVTLAIWAEVLKPWSYEQVRGAVVQRARENRFFPDPSELAAYLPDIKREEQGVGQGLPEELSATLAKRQNELEAWQQEWHQELRERGLPSLREALGQGMSIAQWNAMLKEAGVWD